MKRALIVGPTYPAPYQLAATVNNINNWNNTLKNYRGFNNRVILQGNLPASQIKNAIEALVASTIPGDSSVIVLLGHGGRMVDTSGDELDGYDECFAGSDLQPVCDDWLKATLANLPAGAKVDVMHDMCYAGTSTDILRSTKPDDAPKIDPCIRPIANVPFRGPRKARSSSEKAIIPGASNHRLWAACGPSEIAYTCLSGGLWHSLFSLYICWALRAYPAKNATELMNLVAGYVTQVAPGQHPQLEGSDLTAVPF